MMLLGRRATPSLFRPSMLMTPPTLATLTGKCHLTPLSVEFAVVYCFPLSVLFVAALYFLVPPSVRKLERNDARQIKWRMFAVTSVCITATVLYPRLFCARVEENTEKSPAVISALALLGWNLDVGSVIGVLLHTLLLYTGPMVASLLYVQYTCHQLRAGGRNISYFQTFHLLYVEPLMLSQQWSQIRNLIVAPLCEEVIFRGCMVSPLLVAGLQPFRTCCIAPLFFGTAHFHHALVKYQQGMAIRHVIMMTMFQFAYTTLFGAYTTFAFIRTGSILAIAISHAFCNLQGLPDLSFLVRQQQQHDSRLSCLYPYRWILIVSYMMGIVAFIWGFSWTWILPPAPGKLVRAVHESIH